MTAKNPQKQGRILEGVGEFFWLATIYTPAKMCRSHGDTGWTVMLQVSPSRNLAMIMLDARAEVGYRDASVARRAQARIHIYIYNSIDM